MMQGIVADVAFIAMTAVPLHLCWYLPCGMVHEIISMSIFESKQWQQHHIAETRDIMHQSKQSLLEFF
jgi:hypothetical protein